MNVFHMIGRHEAMFERDVLAHEGELGDLIGSSRILVIGGAGTIGQSVVRELFLRNPRALHVVDLSENNLVELVAGYPEYTWVWEGGVPDASDGCQQPLV